METNSFLTENIFSRRDNTILKEFPPFKVYQFPLTLSAVQTIYANNVDPDEMAHN